jgi:hypothetical protein
MADRLRAPVRLVAEPMASDDTDLARLISWYVRHGFEVIGARSGDQAVVMQRPSRCAG